MRRMSRTEGLRGRDQDAEGERSRREHQHECGRSNAFDIADAQMGHDGSNEIEDESDSCRDSHWRPPDSNHQTHRPGKLARGHRGKYFNGTPTVSWTTLT